MSGESSAAQPETEAQPAARPPSAQAAEAEAAPVRLSRWSRITLVAAAALVALATAGQMAGMLLDSAPSNTVSQKYNTQLSWWVSPWMGQNWKLFGPNPQTQNLTVLARAKEANGDQTSWVDLTAIDYAAITHDPMPSHANENELRLAWEAYDNSTPGSEKQSLLQQYLVNFIAQRLGITSGGPFTDVQLEIIDTPMPNPGTNTPKAPTNEYLPWWPLTGQKGSGQ